MTNAVPQPPGWYQAQGDPPGTQRYWDGVQWLGGPEPIPGVSAGLPAGREMVGGMAIALPGKRIMARLIDWVVWLAVLFVGGVVMSVFADVSVDGGSTTSVGVQLLVVAAFAGVLTLYEVGMVVLLGGTIGKMALGLRVRDLDGAPIDVATALLRFSPFLALVAVQRIPIIGGIGTIGIIVAASVALTMLFADRRMQVPWDKLAKTLVLDSSVVGG